MTEDDKEAVVKISIVATLIIAIVAIFFWALPVWWVWKQGLSGEAELNKAEQTKQIMIETAKAEEDSAKYRARAIEIMGEAAKKYPEYRQQEFMQAFGEALREGNVSQIIYVPTEANLPILEAGKRQ